MHATHSGTAVGKVNVEFFVILSFFGVALIVKCSGFRLLVGFTSSSSKAHVLCRADFFWDNKTRARLGFMGPGEGGEATADRKGMDGDVRNDRSSETLKRRGRSPDDLGGIPILGNMKDETLLAVLTENSELIFC